MKHAHVLLGPRHKRILYSITSLLWLSGAVWLYLLETNPTRPLWMKLHGAAAMGFLILLGTLLIRHVPAGWKQDRQRPSGVSILSVCAFLIVTGWGLYYAGSDDLRHLISLSHSTLGLALPLFILFHVNVKK